VSAAGGVLLIASGVLYWVNEARSYAEVTDIGGVKQGPQWALGLVHDVSYLLLLGGLAGLFGLLERARRARPRQATSALSLRLAYCSEVAGIVLIGLAAAAMVANVVQLSTVGVVTIGGGHSQGILPGGGPRGRRLADGAGSAARNRAAGRGRPQVGATRAMECPPPGHRAADEPAARPLTILVARPADGRGHQRWGHYVGSHPLARLVRLLHIRGAQRDHRYQLGAAGVGAWIGPRREPRLGCRRSLALGCLALSRRKAVSRERRLCSKERIS
jgi:hypothetical protein